MSVILSSTVLNHSVNDLPSNRDMENLGNLTININTENVQDQPQMAKNI